VTEYSEMKFWRLEQVLLRFKKVELDEEFFVVNIITHEEFDTEKVLFLINWRN
jgi:hypothetical protein